MTTERPCTHYPLWTAARGWVATCDRHRGAALLLPEPTPVLTNGERRTFERRAS